jgi:deoxyribodipyrimidine photo-lyase
MQVLWFKRDLRLTDHMPLFEALRHRKTGGLTMPVYIHEPSLIADPFFARQHQCFIQECLTELDTELERLGGLLYQLVGEAVQVFDALHQQHGLTAIWAHRETTQRSHYMRDRAVRQWARQNGVAFHELPQNNVIRGSEPEHLKQSFQAYFDAAVQQPIKNPTGKNLAAYFYKEDHVRLNAAQIPKAQGDDKPLRPKGGRSRAKQLAARFFTEQRIKAYPFSISSPNTAWAGCSRLSPYLAYGVVSDREVMQRLNDLVSRAHQHSSAAHIEKVESAARFFLDRLQWRQGYFQQFEHCPELEDTELIPAFKGVRQAQFNAIFFEAWKCGQTGVPFIDAIQRCLDACGWVNMRARAMLVSYACMQLWLPWEDVMKHLAHQFVDFDMAIHAGQHRIASGTSHFQQLLIYNPLKNALKLDPKGEFVAKWVPELAGLPPEHIHTPWLLGAVEQQRYGFVPGETYPLPLVDNDKALAEAKARVHALRSA